MPRLTKTLESATRKKIDLMLSNLHWVIDEYSEKCNVYTERAKTVEQNKKLRRKNPDYVLYKTATDIPIAVIETKRSGQSLAKAQERAIEQYARPLGVNIVFVTDGSIIERFDIRSGTPLTLDDQIITDFLPEKQLLKHIEIGSALRSPERITYTKRELITIFSEANALLRKEGIREGIERFTEFSNLMFLKLISEIEEERENNGEERILDRTYCWESFCNLVPKQMLQYINSVILPKLVKEYNHSSDAFQRHLLINSSESLKKIVDKLTALKLLDADSDVKGDAFEFFLKNSVSIGTDLGEYFTPRHIVKWVVDLVDPKFGDKVYDPACGTGGFLIEAFRHIKNKCSQTPKNIRFLKEEPIYGHEISGTAKIAKMNMIIIGDGHNNIVQVDRLKNPIHGKYDVVLTNFPFSQTTDYSSYYGLNGQDANPVFIKHIIDAMKDGGIAGVVMPEGLLFDENAEYIRVRKILMQTCDVLAVIRLHEFVFKPYTAQPTSILIFRKGQPTKRVWFYDLREDGYKKTGRKLGRPPIKDNDIPQLRQLWHDKDESDHSFIIDANTIAERNYPLSLNTYRRISTDHENWSPLGELCDIHIGGTPSRRNFNYFTGDNLWVKIGDINQMYINDTEEKITDEAIEHSSVKRLPKGTLLFSFKLSLGKVAIAGKELFTNEAIAGLSIKDERVLPKYLYSILPCLDYSPYTQRATKGKTLNKDTLAKISVPVPSIADQKKMIDVLDAQEAKRIEYLQKASDIASRKQALISSLITELSKH